MVSRARAAALVLVVGLARNHSGPEAAALGVLLMLCGIAGRLLLSDLRLHPANFPDSASSHGLRMTVTEADAARVPGRWASEKRAARGL